MVAKSDKSFSSFYFNGGSKLVELLKRRLRRCSIEL